jgi:hypothetical protein
MLDASAFAARRLRSSVVSHSNHVNLRRQPSLIGYGHCNPDGRMKCNAFRKHVLFPYDKVVLGTQT